MEADNGKLSNGEDIDHQDPEAEDFMKKTRSPMKRKRRILHTAVLYLCFFIYGWVVGQRGAAFLDLLLVTNTDVTLGSLLLTLAGLACMLGALVGGFLLDALQKPLAILAGSMLINAVLYVNIPKCTVFPLMGALFFVSYLAFAVTDVVSNTEIARLWAHGSGTAMQALHLIFSIAAILSPLVTQPFLAERVDTLSGNASENHHQRCRNCSDNLPSDNVRVFQAVESANALNRLKNASEFATISDLKSLTNMTATYANSHMTSVRAQGDSHSVETTSNINISASPVEQPRNTSSTEVPIYGKSRVVYAFLISSILCVIALIFLVVILVKERRLSKHTKSSKTTGEVERTKEGKMLVIVAIVLVCIVAGFSCFITFPDFLMTFVVRALDWSKTAGARLTSAYWMGLAGGRLGGVWLVRVLSSAQILAGCLLGLLLALCGLLLAAVFRQHWAVWTCAVGTGMSVGVLFPTSLSYTYQRVTPLTGRIAAMIFTAPMIAAMLNPLLLAHLMTQHDELCYVVVFLGEAAVAAGSFVLLHIVANKLDRVRSAKGQEIVILGEAIQTKLTEPEET